jgi:hypothetical protein
MKNVLSLLTLVLLFSCNNTEKKLYSSPETFWEESLGNHRAVLQVDNPAEAVAVNIYWRRHDRYPERKKFIIFNESGEEMKNIHRIKVDNEHCKLVFGPAEKTGKYYFYYLPYEVQEEYGFYNKKYLKPEQKASNNWVNKNGLKDGVADLPQAKLLELQSRTAFDSFYPMEVIALQAEKDSLLRIHKNDFLVFPEDRKLPIRMLDEIPQRWIENGPSNKFKGKAQRNEYYTFQLGVFAAQKDLNDLKVEFSPLKNSDTEIPVSKLTCFNTGGIGPYGEPFVKRLDLEQGKVQPLWIGVDIPENSVGGNYTGTIKVAAQNAEPQIINISLEIDNKVLADRGDSEAWRHSRLRWLNSTLGIDDEPTKPFQPIKILGERTYGFTGKKMTMAENGFPGSLDVKGTEILNRPISFVVETQKGEERFSAPINVELLKNKPGIMSGAWKSISENIEISGVGIIEADGFINYKLKLKALNAIKAKDIRLEIPFKSEVAKYMMGMDLPGTKVPENHKAKWNGPHDSFWIGNANAGIWCEFRGSDYTGPLLNLYHPEYPESWNNGGKGGFKIKSTKGEVKAVAFSGSRNLKKGEVLEFEWSFLITPVKDVNYKSQFTNRYYHNGGNPMPSDKDLESGVKIVNLHHANNYNPHINYPFVAVDSMKWFVDKMHEKGQKVKIYYTIRELTNYTSEIWALRSLGDEILGNGRGGGYPWLREHLVSGYRPQWYQWFPDKSADASIVNAPGDSRWYNYYIEGLKWMIENIDIDGLYLDDVSYDRRTVKRIRKVLDNTKPGCLIDLHSNTGFSKGPATQYTEFFPYIDKLWFGESFKYNEMSPENWLVEVSGIPFGQMGDMLQGGGNRWLGMLFGMTTRLPWSSDKVKADPRPVWKIWDEFQIDDAEMIGFWDDNSPVSTTNSDVKATLYKKQGKSLISIGNFSDSSKNISLKIDFEKLGLNADNVKLVAPAIHDFQTKKEWKMGEKINVEARKGWLIYIEN